MSIVSQKARDKLQRLQAMRDDNRLSDDTLEDLAMTRSEIDNIAGARAGLPSQMLEMAKLFGLDEKDVSSPRWRALEIADTCKQCQKANGCFNYLIGDRSGTFTEADCPNAERYAETSLESSKTR